MNSLKEFSLIKQKIKKLPYNVVKEHLIIAVEERKESFLLAVVQPISFNLRQELRIFLKKEIEEFIASKPLIEEGIEICYRQQEGEAERLFSAFHGENPIKEIEDDKVESYDLLERTDKNPVVQMLNAILSEAIEQGASDIHFEPQKDELMLRYRIDGILQKRATPPKEFQSQILTRIKVMAKLDIAERRLPQDGRIKLNLGGREIDFRVSTLPVIHGERIVLRILDRSNLILGLHHLGMNESYLADFRRLIKLTEGIILVTGPTGSGKTTTLYSALSEMNSSDVNIMTIEDPVEYKIPSIAQIAVNPKINLTFATGLRHILRQDPDIVMIGEIRDRETSQIAIQASLTGHLVLSTLHTNDAPSAITRLADMGVEPYLLSSSIIGVVAQRLVRQICPKCKVPYTPTCAELSEFKLVQDDLKKGKLFRGKGCDSCFQTGYKGRIGIYELMILNPHIKKQIMRSVDAEEIRAAAIHQNMISLKESGIALIKEGRTTIEELLKVTSAID